MNQTHWTCAIVTAIIGLSPAVEARAQTLQMDPAGPVLQGQPVAVRLTDVAPGASVEITAERRFGRPAGL